MDEPTPKTDAVWNDADADRLEFCRTLELALARAISERDAIEALAYERAGFPQMAPGAAAAELARLRACEKDAGRYRCWRNAKVAEVSHDYHFDYMLGKIESACDLAEEIDSAIDEARAAIEKGAL